MYLLCRQGATNKDVQQELVKNYHVEYQELTDDKKAEMLLEYSKHKETQAMGIQILKSQRLMMSPRPSRPLRTRAEAILYIMCGSTGLPLCGVTFATEGVDEFMASVMNVDNQDLISKMEGFAIQGMKTICHEIQKELVAITKDKNVKMHWVISIDVGYFRD
ncbi:hypothetical protein DEU56DRAFT_759714 [Suillus clintonianus]|uniref:uncharacterized protein n=1 Tax=Suillus clintonianus TaxID=1904413 RepID=UPI001B885E9F|nr:uncharacterized protein DEU56DRAFT_759714 [Suillus clintonianus]KAG2124356.1 hypothetical protein DEU56DRAFT_759714 [Suillus clintonianus]